MGASSELSLGYRSQAQAAFCKTYPFVNISENLKERDEYLKGLEEERRKIEAFKRELPLCMQLVNDAIQALRRHEEEYKEEEESRQVVEDFLGRRGNCNSEAGEDRPNWIADVQLWSQCEKREENTHNCSSAVRPLPKHGVIQGLGGAFSPFVRSKQCEAEASDAEEKMSSEQPQTLNETQTQTQTQAQAQAQAAHRKARRCWSPELHRRFVAALQHLGGSQVATPKQIRELMKVDGLTNDEVKSHLQKYRLHTRRPGPGNSCQAGGGVAQSAQLLLVGGIWVPPEYSQQSCTASYGHELLAPATQIHPLFLPQPDELVQSDDGDLTETEDSKTWSDKN